MKALTKSLLAAAVLAAMPLSGALACTTSAWNGTVSGATAGDPGDGIARYSGECGLEVAAGGNAFVTDNSPGAESDYRARFYVYTGTVSGNPVIFRATADDDAGGATRVEITYDTDNNQFDFSANGASGSANGIVDNRWYSIEFYYSESDAFTATVQGAGSDTPIPVTVAGAPGAGTIGSARMGAATAATAADTMRFDEFESTRSTTTAIGRLTVGDANGDAFCNANDLSEVAAEIAGSLGGTPDLATGQPDCTEDGTMNANDLSCVSSIVVEDLFNGTTCGV